MADTLTQYIELEAQLLETLGNFACARGDYGLANKRWAEAAEIGTVDPDPFGDLAADD